MRDDTESAASLTYSHCDSPSSDQPASPTFKHSLVPLEPLWANDFPHGLTPPPESLDPGELYLDYQSSIYSAGQLEPNSIHPLEVSGIRQPPTPPRAEPSPTLHKSPSRLSGGSRDSDGPSPGSSVPTPEAIFPEGDVKMMDLEPDSVSNEPGIDLMGFSDEMTTQGYGEEGQQFGKTMTEFFDFESAASSPLNTTSQLVSPNPSSKFQPCSPLHGSLSPQPQPFQHTFSAGAQSITDWCSGMHYAGNNGLDNNSNGVTPARPSPNRVNRRKRALPGGNFDNLRDVLDEGSRSANISPPVTEKGGDWPSFRIVWLYKFWVSRTFSANWNFI
ncbi:hypothetical protein HOY80DRAFT_731483 [Tuber brumale]|nr:hypothetical protein HOY80DRAFT_731483 [Tuber brumale]